MKRTSLLLIACLFFLLALGLSPLPIPAYLDFQVIYHADMGLLRGIPIYDHAGQVNMIAVLANVLPAQVYVLPFPYPPWYALVTLPLAYLPIINAARVWFGLNLLMLFAAIWLLTDGWEPRRRLASVLISLFFWPILGSLFIGQYGFPILLGAALFAYGMRYEKAGLTAIAAGLLTFKPHLGLLVLLLGLISLFSRRDPFGRRAWMAIAAAGLLLFGFGFLASPLWPVAYFHSLTGFKDVSQCHQCNNVSMILAGFVGGGFDQAIWVAMLLLVLFALWLVWQRRVLQLEPHLLVAAGVLVTLLVSPYLQNYDYILLLFPLLVRAASARKWEWFFLALAYLLPLFGLVVSGRAGQASLVLSTLISFILLVRAMRPLDVSPPAAYNQVTTE